MPPLVIATTNSHKTVEISAFLGKVEDGWIIEDLSDYPHLTQAPETGVTFEENAALKAVSVSHQLSGRYVLADDSGIEVDALGGAPGVWSARYAGENADDVANRAKLLKELEQVSDAKDRTARFCCVMILAYSGEVIANVRGEIEGTLTMDERGEGGFGYDPIFIPEGHDQTFAQLPLETKNSISHRSRALSLLARRLQSLR